MSLNGLWVNQDVWRIYKKSAREGRLVLILRSFLHEERKRTFDASGPIGFGVVGARNVLVHEINVLSVANFDESIDEIEGVAAVVVGI